MNQFENVGTNVFWKKMYNDFICIPTILMKKKLKFIFFIKKSIHNSQPPDA